MVLGFPTFIPVTIKKQIYFPGLLPNATGLPPGLFVITPVSSSRIVHNYRHVPAGHLLKRFSSADGDEDMIISYGNRGSLRGGIAWLGRVPCKLDCIGGKVPWSKFWSIGFWYGFSLSP